ncbi:hypothetical protein [Ruegeria sp. AU67]|uniref:hypothetical protein n=1 Tax=Ruegeria sp. AU67 TaxID=2108530 RepID=UPI000D69ABEA|nr:hypothetical protein [Ruegeria sp. AU67]
MELLIYGNIPEYDEKFKMGGSAFCKTFWGWVGSAPFYPPKRIESHLEKPGDRSVFAKKQVRILKLSPLVVT